MFVGFKLSGLKLSGFPHILIEGNGSMANIILSCLVVAVIALTASERRLGTVEVRPLWLSELDGLWLSKKAVSHMWHQEELQGCRSTSCVIECQPPQHCARQIRRSRGTVQICRTKGRSTYSANTRRKFRSKSCFRGDYGVRSSHTLC